MGTADWGGMGNADIGLWKTADGGESRTGDWGGMGECWSLLVVSIAICGDSDSRLLTF
jgi:hypothetical protein